MKVKTDINIKTRWYGQKLVCLLSHPYKVLTDATCKVDIQDVDGCTFHL